ncbi:hypothetical protein A2773_04105 [Candidatus Gottesmanbacteria bacterium RIFCSPHIGHO2_01_FULL_39_10]|uniref:Polymerase nucleotidyl transferase domain-containing protein n=1 Tax=Candidatus Gottesmanbacteria bacterium RIFCSPHIGHO2_01_FULL_39_10 TaxID=1798375 RepID=A0A1F5ZQK0_9BACT|nr:MAG: hypothetical protein A2773_04105 [Candidatus Gottesmanbacteria bacterium RIFCSPHIGHO2_01_FULL_39_10]
MKKNKSKEAILKTLIYSDIFDYPLTRQEIQKWVIQYNNLTIDQFNNELKKIKNIQIKNGYYFLKGRDNIVSLRKQREKYSQGKLAIALKAASLLKIIPSIRLIGITGALAMNNTKKDDDIDLFIITKKNLLWTTRFLATIILELAGLRRHPEVAIASDKICLNMFMDEEFLEIPEKERDLFSAHEVLQMKSIMNKNNTYYKFLLANSWVKKYLPNAFDEEIKKMEIEKLRVKNKKNLTILNILEALLKRFQLWYMHKHRTSEVIRQGMIRFHPQDARKWILDRYHNSPLDKPFSIF